MPFMTGLPVQAPGSGGSSVVVPPLTGVLYAVLMENPIGAANWVLLTEDMIAAAFAINSFALSGAFVTVVEVGATVTNPTFTASYNRAATLVELDDGINPTFPITLPGTAFGITAAYHVTTVNGTVTFTLSANDATSPVVTDTVTITWEPRVYFGAAVDPGSPYTELFIEGLSGNGLDNNRQRTINYVAGATESLFYAFPTSYGGSASNFLDASTGFAAGFSKVATGVSVENANLVTISYDVWRSDQVGLGTVSIQVT